MDRAAWISRHVTRYQQLAGTEGVLDRLAAETAADEQAELYGTSGIAWELPEDVAEREFDGLESMP